MCSASPSVFGVSRRPCFGPCSDFIGHDFFDLIFVQRSTVVSVQPSALDRYGGRVDIRRNHLELTRPEGWQLSDQILVAPAFFQQMAHLFDILWLSEATDECRVRLRQDFVINVADILRSKNTRNTVFSGLFENEFDEVLCRRVPWVWWQIWRHFIHEEQQLQFPLGGLLR